MADPIDTDAVRAIICSLSCACHPALSAACDEVDHLRAELILAEKGRREDAAAHMANEAGVDRLRAENAEARNAAREALGQAVIRNYCDCGAEVSCGWCHMVARLRAVVGDDR